MENQIDIEDIIREAKGKLIDNTRIEETVAINQKNKREKARIERLVRLKFGTLVRNDFCPIGTKIHSTREMLVDVWKEAGYKIGAEIGVWRGYFSNEIIKRIGPEGHHYSIDPWAVYMQSHLTEENQKKNIRLAMDKLGPHVQSGRATVIREHSEVAVHRFKDESLDYLFIDGAHDFNHCVMDLIQWVPKVRRGGIVAVHDYTPMRRCGVVDAVDSYTKCNLIYPWYVIREALPTAFWVR